MSIHREKVKYNIEYVKDDGVDYHRAPTRVYARVVGVVPCRFNWVGVIWVFASECFFCDGHSKTSQEPAGEQTQTEKVNNHVLQVPS